MQRLNRLIPVLIAVCFLLQMPLSAMAKEAPKLPSGTVMKKLPPDLVVSKITYSPGSPTAGSGLMIKVYFKNVGRDRVEASVAHVKVGGESVPATVNVPALNIGQEWRYTRKFMPTKPARYVVMATADQPNRIAELDERNNVKSITISVKKDMRKAMKAASPTARTTKTPAVAGQPKTMRTAPAKATAGLTANQAMKHLMKAEITNFEIGTDTDGRWFWRATVKNTGSGTINANTLKLKTTQIKWGPANNPPVPGSVRLVTLSIAPGASKTFKTHWERCCLANELAVELVVVASNNVLDQTSIPNLIYGVPGVIFNKKIKRIEWDNTAKTWQATLQNNTPYYLKMVVQGVLIKGNNVQPVAAGGQRMLIGPNQTKKSMKFHAANAVNGDKIKVSFYFDQSTMCTDSARDCGAERGNITTVPNSSDFP